MAVQQVGSGVAPMHPSTILQPGTPQALQAAQAAADATTDRLVLRAFAVKLTQPCDCAGWRPCGQGRLLQLRRHAAGQPGAGPGAAGNRPARGGQPGKWRCAAAADDGVGRARVLPHLLSGLLPTPTPPQPPPTCCYRCVAAAAAAAAVALLAGVLPNCHSAALLDHPSCACSWEA